MTAGAASAPRSIERVAVVGTGLMGTSVALAAARAGATVTGWDVDPSTTARAAAFGGFTGAGTLGRAVEGAELVVVCTPITMIADSVAAALSATTDAIVTEVGSIMDPVAREVAERADQADLRRFVPGHPMGGSERSGPEHASPSVLDGIVWVVTPAERSDDASIARLEGWVSRVGARPIRMDAERHDRLVAMVSHLPQVASTALMGLAASEEAGEPEILLLAAGGFRDLTRLAASNPHLWSDILLANGAAIGRASFTDFRIFCSAVAGLTGCTIQPRAATPKPVWNPDIAQTIDFFDTWQDVPENRVFDNAFKVEWELFLKHVVAGGPFQWNLREGAKGVQLAELGLRSWRERRWIDVPPLES